MAAHHLVLINTHTISDVKGVHIHSFVQAETHQHEAFRRSQQNTVLLVRLTLKNCLNLETSELLDGTYLLGLCSGGRLTPQFLEFLHALFQQTGQLSHRALKAL